MSSRVLIIEDDLAQKPLWDSIIRRNFDSPRTDWAVSGEEAKRHFDASIETKSHYDLIVVDLFLAGSDTGLDFLSHLHNLTSTTPILLVSAADEVELRRHFEAVPPHMKILAKPLNVPKCERALQSLLQKEEWPYDHAF